MSNQSFLIKRLTLVLTIISLMSCNTKTKSKEINLFNGENLDGWKGNVKIWSAENGCIVGKTTEENKIEKNSFLIQEQEFSNFEFTFQYKIIGGNSGVQYRSKVIDEKEFVVSGYQADIEAGVNYSGILYEEKGRGILAKRGEQVKVLDDGKKEVSTFTTSEIIQSKINNEDWNDYKIIANGDHLQHFINNTKTVDVLDKEVDKSSSSGIIALQVHTGPNMTVFYKNLVIKPILN